jgi:hypothetical protein
LDGILTDDEKIKIERRIQDLTDDTNGRDATKFSQYQLEGQKENYKELQV